MGKLLSTVALAIALMGPAMAQDTPQQGGTLTVAIETDLREAGALMARISVDKLVVGSTVYDPLFQTDEAGNSLPALATGAHASDDALTWTFDIREGVKFHNGKVLTAADVKKTIDAILDPARASNLAGDLSNIASVEAVDDRHVRITLKQPDSRLPSLFTDNVFIADMDAYDPQHPIGTGPYQWGERTVGDHITFTRFEGHWRGVPPLDQVVFRVIPDAQVAALSLQAGDVDIIPTNVSSDALPALRADEGLQIYETDGNTWYGAYFNFEKGRQGGYGTDEQFHAFREGMAHLWNGQEIVPAIIGEFGSFATQVTPPWQLGSDPDIQARPYDPELGKQLLAQAGIEPGATLKIIAQDWPHECDVATAVASQLTEQGYEIDLSCYQPEPFYDAVRKYDWDLEFSRVSGRANAWRNYRDRWRSTLAPNPPDDQWTYRSDKVDQLIVEMGGTTDDAAYAALGKQITDTIITQDIAALPLYFDTVRVVARDRVQGIKISPLVYYGFLMNQMTTVWLKDQ